MTWVAQLIDRVASAVPCGYEQAGPPATEPTAIAALALVAHQRYAAAESAANWLADLQRWDGSVGVTETQARPKWPTSLALLVWLCTDPLRYGNNIKRALKWTLAERGTTSPQQAHIGHDTTLAGWSWAADTHSWLEPTAFFVLALKRAGHDEHPRTREAVRLLLDRLLPDGGANYGNTIVLGQPLLPHVLPTGLSMMALAGENTADARLEGSLAYLRNELSDATPTASLCFGLLGLHAHGRRPEAANNFLRSAYQRQLRRPPSPYRFALLALAAAQRNAFLAHSLGAPSMLPPRNV